MTASGHRGPQRCTKASVMSTEDVKTHSWKASERSIIKSSVYCGKIFWFLFWQDTLTVRLPQTILLFPEIRTLSLLCPESLCWNTVHWGREWGRPWLGAWKKPKGVYTKSQGGLEGRAEDEQWAAPQAAGTWGSWSPYIRPLAVPNTAGRRRHRLGAPWRWIQSSKPEPASPATWPSFEGISSSFFKNNILIAQ